MYDLVTRLIHFASKDRKNPGRISLHELINIVAAVVVLLLLLLLLSLTLLTLFIIIVKNLPFSLHRTSNWLRNKSDNSGLVENMVVVVVVVVAVVKVVDSLHFSE